MSATRPSQRPTEHSHRTARRPAAMSELKARRRAARRRRQLARLDLALGFFAALVLLIASPGLAITAIVALFVLAVCVGSFVVERKRRQRGSSTKTAMSRLVRRS